ncbi:hypothetical protein INR49_027680, partial [Caranx melampygus]
MRDASTVRSFLGPEPLDDSWWFLNTRSTTSPRLPIVVQSKLKLLTFTAGNVQFRTNKQSPAAVSELWRLSLLLILLGQLGKAGEGCINFLDSQQALGSWRKCFALFEEHPHRLRYIPLKNKDTNCIFLRSISHHVILVASEYAAEKFHDLFVVEVVDTFYHTRQEQFHCQGRRLMVPGCWRSRPLQLDETVKTNHTHVKFITANPDHSVFGKFITFTSGLRHRPPEMSSNWFKFLFIPHKRTAWSSVIEEIGLISPVKPENLRGALTEGSAGGAFSWP